MPETCENWLGFVKRCIYYGYQTCEIYQVLPYSVDFKAALDLWNPLSECSFRPVIIWNDRKAQK